MCTACLCVCMTVLLLSGCEVGSGGTSEASVFYREYSNASDEIAVTVVTDPVTTQTQEIELQLVNTTNRELTYNGEKIVLERETDGGFVSVGRNNYGTGHEI